MLGRDAVTELLIWSNYLAATAFALWRVSRIDLTRLTFTDGLLIGMIYYLAVPMLLILIEGQISAQFIMSNDYFPYRDLDTTLTILVCLYFMPLLHLVLPRADGATQDKGSDRVSFDRTLLVFVAVMYFGSTIAGFILSGLWAGGHWYTTTHEALSSNASALVFRHLANFSRTAIFGLLAYSAASGAITRRSFHLLGLAIVVCDLLLTFNRITAAYYLISLVLLYRDRKFVVSGVVVGLILVIPAISNMWPMFRGLATRDGYTLHGLISAAEMALRSATAYGGLADFTSGVFESINIPVLNYIVQNHGDALQVEPGSIYLRPATIFLPTMVWSDRPAVFGTILGAVINDSTSSLALNSTLMGEPYGNFGAWWPLGIFPMYLIYHLIFLQLSRYSPGFGAIGAFCAVAMWRFDSTVAVIALILSLVLLLSVRIWLSSSRPAASRVPR